MEGVAVRMARDTDTPTPPHALRMNFDEVVALLDQAEEHTPAAIGDDVAAFAGTTITTSSPSPTPTTTSTSSSVPPKAHSSRRTPRTHSHLP